MEAALSTIQTAEQSGEKCGGGGKERVEKKLYLQISCCFLLMPYFSPSFICCFLNPSSLKALHESVHVTSVFHSNPVKFTIVLFSHNRLLNYLRR